MGAEWLDREIDRRDFLIKGALGTSALALAACGTTSVVSKSSELSGNVVLSSWNNPGDLTTLKQFAQSYQAAHPKVQVTIAVTPSTDFDAWFAARLAGGQAPDIIRLQYQELGRYASNGSLVDLAPHLPSGYGDQFLPAFWNAVQYKKGVYGIPEHTDTFATFYRTDVMQQIGVTPPTSLDKAWSWSDLLNIVQEVKTATGKYALGFGYAGANTAYRWLPILYMHGGALFGPDGKTPTINSAEGVAALTWTQNLYKNNLVPPDNTVKNSKSTTARQYFINGVIGVMLHGDWQLQPLQSAMQDNQWGVTYMVRDKSQASDIGGNALTVTKDSQSLAAAVDFLLYCNTTANTQTFVTDNGYLPVLKSLSAKTLQYSYRPDVMQKFVQQATTIPAAMAKVETSASFSDVNLLLADQLDLCFTGQQSPQQTAVALSDGLKSIVH